jgi:hypothetical protein
MKTPRKKIIIQGLTGELAAHGDGYRGADNSLLHKRQRKHAQGEASNNGTTIKDSWACEKLRQHCSNQSGPSQNHNNQITHAKTCHVMQTILKGNKNICITFIREGMGEGRCPVNERKHTHTIWFYSERRNKGEINLGVIVIGGRI